MNNCQIKDSFFQTVESPFPWMEENNEPAYMPAIWDGPRSFGFSRLTSQHSNVQCQEGMAPDWVYMKEPQNFTQWPEYFESISTSQESKKKTNSIKILQWPKSSNKHSSRDLSKEEHKSENKYESKNFPQLEKFSMEDFHNQKGKIPSQSSKTVTNSFIEDGTNNIKQKQKNGKPRLKRGETQKYLREHTAEEIVYNTLWGILIKFIRKNGPQPLEILVKLVTAEYKNIRKLSGHYYTGNILKSVKGALTSNGLFKMVDEGGKIWKGYSDSGSSKGSGISQNNLWTVSEEAAEELIKK